MSFDGSDQRQRFDTVTNGTQSYDKDAWRWRRLIKMLKAVQNGYSPSSLISSEVANSLKKLNCKLQIERSSFDCITAFILHFTFGSFEAKQRVLFLAASKNHDCFACQVRLQKFTIAPFDAAVIDVDTAAVDQTSCLAFRLS